MTTICCTNKSNITTLINNQFHRGGLWVTGSGSRHVHALSADQLEIGTASKASGMLGRQGAHCGYHGAATLGGMGRDARTDGDHQSMD